ncbi:hypothetical protein [Longimicrobium terrae]|uniref:Uncharacterized protein n=1 Tax=Longimicrobium terrae TaxID=1639882 RepID=A0A841H1K7_9BACT|nr:hypothetical protein [Longimicrobium terrae]MBB4637456.1 hypothetical protein [Longimicrobium terrae]MBB6071854.1 hypothetical protein [Longimicrobium terrae]NNC30403.1 hypothetical protein [Longimicrobium terrae]
MGVLNMIVPGRQSVRTAAAMGAANFALRRWGGPRGAKVSRVLSNATWALPLGMMAFKYVRDRRKA